jgi:hypothetical protein
MNRPARIHFHQDADVRARDLPERYLPNVTTFGPGDDQVRTILVQVAFPIDYAPSIIRTRLDHYHDDPVDFPLVSISMIEWFYGDQVPDPLRPYEKPPRKRVDQFETKDY